MSSLNIDVDEVVAILTSVAILSLLVERITEIISELLVKPFISRSARFSTFFPADEMPNKPKRRRRFLFISVTLGILLAASLQVRVFEALGFSGRLDTMTDAASEATEEQPWDAFVASLPAALDTIFTGLLIGGGSDPLHQTVKKIQKWGSDGDEPPDP